MSSLGGFLFLFEKTVPFLALLFLSKSNSYAFRGFQVDFEKQLWKCDRKSEEAKEIIERIKLEAPRFFLHKARFSIALTF